LIVRQRLALLLFIFVMPLSAFGQIFGSTSDSPRSLALGRSDLADTRDEWNPNAAMPSDTFSNLRAVLSPEPLGLSQSYSAGVSGDIPLESGWMAGSAFSLYQFASTFSWESFGVQASKTFLVGPPGDSTSRKVVVGMRVRYSQETLGQASDAVAYLPINDFGVDLGASFDLFPQLTLAAAATHLVTLYNNQDIPIEDPVAWAGFSYRATSDFTIDGTLETSSYFHPAFHGGAEYALSPNLFVRAGGDTQTGEISAGLGVTTNNFSADFTAIRHPDLGTFISFGIGFKL
jgi:hypothetical protein